MGSNERLANLIEEAGFSRRSLATAVNDLGKLSGINLNYGKPSVVRWVAGQQPRYPVPTLILEVFRSRLQRSIDYADVGFDSIESDVETQSLWYRDLPTTISIVSSLWSHEVYRRNFLGSSVAVAGALASPMRELAVFDHESISHDGPQRVRPDDIGMIRDVARQYWAWDSKYGGGRFRQQLIYFLQSHVSPLLSGSYGESTGRELHSAVSEATMLAGWMAYDMGMYGLSQRYYTQALRMAKAANCRMLTSEILTCMAYIACESGHSRTAVRLCEHALSLTKGQVSHRVLSYIYSVQARCLARVQPTPYAPDALTALDAAERHFEYSLDGSENSWVAGIDLSGLRVQTACVLTDLGIVKHGHEAVTAAIEGKSESHRRSLAFAHIYRGTLYLHEFEVEAAVESGNRALDLLNDLRTARATERLRRFQKDLNQLGDTDSTRLFNERMRGLARE